MVLALTAAAVLARSRAARLEDVRTLNCCGQGLGDVGVLSRCTSVEVLSLSVNAVASLRPFAQLRRLRELYLRRNAVASLDELRWLMPLEPTLRVLSLSENPVAQQQQQQQQQHGGGNDYRAFVVRQLPSLERLDEAAVTDADRAAAQRQPRLQPPTPGELLAAAAARGGGAGDDDDDDSGDEEGAATAEEGGEVGALAQARGNGAADAADEAAMCGCTTAAVSAAAAAAAGLQQQQLDRPATAAAEALSPPRVCGCGCCGHATSRSPPPPPPAQRAQQQPGCAPGVLYAAVALVGELDALGLQVLKAEVSARLAELQPQR